MTLFRLDYYYDDNGELIGFFTSKEAAMQYALHDRKVDTPTTRSWTELWEFKYNGNIELEEKLDGRVSTKQGLKAWDKCRIINSTYYV